jgi:hypothetical protein
MFAKRRFLAVIPAFGRHFGMDNLSPWQKAQGRSADGHGNPPILMV